MSQVAAIIVAAGKGTRSGLSMPKQFSPFLGKQVLRWSAEAFSRDARFGNIVVAVSPGQEALAASILEGLPKCEIVRGGKERADTVRAALKHLIEVNPTGLSQVFIHDAARPGLSQLVINDLFEALKTHICAAPALPIADALKVRRTENRFDSVNRDHLWRVQTPQAFRFKEINSAHTNSQVNFVDDLEAAAQAGYSIALTAGDRRLMKLTYPDDFDTLERLLMDHAFPRIGQGFDVHAFEPGVQVTLCGVHIPCSRKLKGHSDADVAWHALTDAIYGALGAGDIGFHFPPTEDKWRNISSDVFLKHAVELASTQGFMVGNADITIICEQPKISPHVFAMKQATAKVLSTNERHVSIKATTTEKLGFTGREEGIAAQACVLLAPFKQAMTGG